MASFWVVDLSGTGEVRLKQEYEYRILETLPGAIELISLFSTHLWRSPDEFELPLPGGRLAMRWRTCSQPSGIATLGDGDTLASLRLVLSGGEADADVATLKPLQLHLV